MSFHPTNSVLKISNMTVGYGDKLVLQDVNLQLHRSELVCLMGQNGMGKTTLLRSVIGLQKPIMGVVSIHGTDINELSIAEKSKRISLVLTEKPATGNLSVRELVSMGRYPYLGWGLQLNESDNAIVDGALNNIGLQNLSERKINTLSDGQLQKAMIARALVQDGDLIILDEPTAHLDLNNRVEIMHMLQNLAHNAGKAIVLATHELDLALQMADTIWLIDNNHNVRTGVPEDLVLNGSMDEVFGHKGYNLKTGKVEHFGTGMEISVSGAEGYGLLWTKNAIERTGCVVADSGETTLLVEEMSAGVFRWTLQEKNRGEYVFNSIAELIAELQKQQHN